MHHFLTQLTDKLCIVHITVKVISLQRCAEAHLRDWNGVNVFVETFLIRGHSTTTWTNFDPILTPLPPSSGQAWTFTYPPPPVHVDKTG